MHVLPAAFRRKRLADRFDAERGPVDELDTYLLGSTPDVNVKVRARTRSLKLKGRESRAEDGFELWRTAADASLPAPGAVWADVAALLGVELDVARLAAPADPGEVAALLCRSGGGVRCVQVQKNRTAFLAPNIQIEVAEVAVADGVFHSVAFESPDLALARSLRREFGSTALGAPENYVAFCARVAG
jgi:hypothetical protein